MSHFEHSTKLGYAALVLSDNDVKVLLPIVRRALRIEQNAVDRYKDILDGGDATERQQTCLMKHMEQESALQVIVDEMKTIIKAK